MGKLRKNATEFCTNIGRLQCVQLLRSGTRQTLLFVSQAESCKGCLESKVSTCQRQGKTSSRQSRKGCLESKESTCQRQGQTSSRQSRENKARRCASTCCEEGQEFCTNIGRLQCVQLLRSDPRQTLLFVSQAQSCKGCLESKVSTCQRQGQTSSGQSRENKADWTLLFASTCCKEGKDSGGTCCKDRGGWAERVQPSEGNSQAAARAGGSSRALFLLNSNKKVRIETHC